MLCFLDILAADLTSKRPSGCVLETDLKLAIFEESKSDRQSQIRIIVHSYLQTSPCRPWYRLRFRLASVFASFASSLYKSAYNTVLLYLIL